MSRLLGKGFDGRGSDQIHYVGGLEYSGATTWHDRAGDQQTRRGAHMSAGHFSRQFRLAYGESPYAYLMTRRIERAMALLRRGDLSVTEVCFAVGCSSLGTFSSRFTELGGMPPSVYRRQAARDGGDAVLRGETGDQTDQESRSAGPRAAPIMTAMDITIHASFLPHDNPDASMAFYRDALGFEVRNDVGYGGMRWITVGPADQPGTSIVLYPPFAAPGVTDDERRTIAEMMAKGTYAIILLATADLDGAFARLQASVAEVVQEPTEQPYGVRDCALRDPAGNLIRIQELSSHPTDAGPVSPPVDVDLFAGLPVSDLPRAVAWYDRLLGDVETFVPNDTEHVWTLAEHGHVYVELAPEHAGHARVTLFVTDLDGFLATAANRGVESETRETYDNGVRKAIFRDPDGNEVGVGGPPAT